MNSPCPGDETWLRLLGGAMTEEPAEPLARHLEVCPTCRRKLEQLAGGQTTSFVFAAAGEAHGVESVALEQVMILLKSGVAPGSAPELPDVHALLQPARRAHALGTFGGYDILEIVAVGGMGVVLKAFDPSLERLVAIKLLPPPLAANPEARERFLREARAAAAVHHDNIIVIHAVGEAAGLPYIVMQFIAGGTLQQWLEQRGALSFPEVLQVGRQVAAGLAAAHAAGLVHRDIKPGNILLEDGLTRVRITDFGLVHSVQQTAGREDRWVAGTPQFMSPEQAAGEPTAAASDSYSFGAMLYALAAGRPPFQAANLTGLLLLVRTGTPEPLERQRSDLPAAFCRLVQRMMSKAADARPSANEVAATLAALEQPGTRATQGWRMLAAAGVVLLAVAGILSFNFERRQRVNPVRFRLESSGATWDSFAAAAAAAVPGDTIDVAGRGPLLVDAVRLAGKPLRIRALPGAAPVLVVTNQTQPLLTTDRALVLEGLTLERRINLVALPPLIRVTNAPLRLAFCRLVKSSLVPRTVQERVFFIEAVDAPVVELSHCEILPQERAVGALLSRYTSAHSGPHAATAGLIRIEHSLLAGLAGIELLNHTPRPAQVELNRSVFIQRALIRLDHLPPANAVHVAATNCVFDVDSLVLGVTRGPEHFSDGLRWAGQDNRYSVNVGFVTVPGRMQPVPLPAHALTVDRWMILTNVTENGSRPAKLQLWDHLLNMGLAPETLNARSLPLPATLDLPEGPDFEHVGPGAPYEKWRRSAAYAGWFRTALTPAREGAAAGRPPEE